MATFFKVNSSLDLSLDFSANFVATRKVSDKPIEVPQQRIEYFTYVLPKQAEKGIIRLEDDKEEDEKYDLSIFLKPINDSDNKAKEVFVKLTVGCTSPKSFDLANVDWPIKIEGLWLYMVPFPFDRMFFALYLSLSLFAFPHSIEFSDHDNVFSPPTHIAIAYYSCVAIS